MTKRSRGFLRSVYLHPELWAGFGCRLQGLLLICQHPSKLDSERDMHLFETPPAHRPSAWQACTQQFKYQM
jgi:hypothetical protein